MRDQDEDFASLLGRFLVRMGFTQQELANKIGMHRNTIVKWMNRTSWPTSRGQVLRVADKLFLLKEERKALIQAAGFSLGRWWPTEIWTVPEPRDVFFTGRKTILQSLQEFLVPGGMMALTQAISGLGGIGKTHTAVEYAYHFHENYEAVLWLQADSWEILASACSKLADTLGIPEQKEPDQIIKEVQRWLQEHRHWLLILDNVENPQEILSKFVPTGHQGCVLATTRVHNVEPLAQTQILSTMSEHEGVLFLLRRTTRIASKAELEKASLEQYAEAKQIWELLDGLPLALDQAGAYILETGCSFSTYQEQYACRHGELLLRRGKRFIGHEASVATTFSLTLEKIKSMNPLAADILRICSLLYSEAIPEEIFQEGAALLELSLGKNGSLDEALGILQDYSLVLRRHEGKLLSIHRLVQIVQQSAMQASERGVWVNRVIKALEAIFPVIDYTVRKQCDRLLPHVLFCITHISSDTNTDRELALLLFKTASYLYDRARYVEAKSLHLRALSIWEQTPGSNHLHAAELNDLALIYVQQGQYTQAKSLYEKAVFILTEIFGYVHPILADTFGNLAFLYSIQGDYEQAAQTFQHSLSIYEQTLGSDHPRVAPLLTNLASFYKGRGQDEQAEQLYQKALLIWEQVPSSKHPHLACLLYGLADLYLKQGKDGEAELLYQRALYIREQTLGDDHPETTLPLYGLCIIALKQGRYKEAEQLSRRALGIQERIPNPEHHVLAQLLNVLSDICKMQGKDVEAETLYQRALSFAERIPEKCQIE